MQHRGEVTRTAEGFEIPQHEIDARKQELEAEFKRYMHKAPAKTKQRQANFAKPEVEIGLKNFLAELANDNKQKQTKHTAYFERYQRMVFGPSSGQVGFFQ